MKKTNTNIFKVININRGDEFYIKGSPSKEQFKKMVFEEFCWSDDKENWKEDVLVERVRILDWKKS